MTAMRLIIAGGGTGGHLYPGVAVAEALLARDSAAKVLFIGTARGIEARVLPQLGFDLRLIRISGLKGLGIAQKLSALFRLPAAVLECAAILRAFKPHAILSVGGYAAGPAGLAAALLRLPLAVLEQNTRPGLTNRALGKLASRVFGTFDESRPFFPTSRFVLTGNPLRMAFVRRVDELHATNASATTVPATPPHVLVTGGSQGASALNKLAVAAFTSLGARAKNIRITHQTGAADEAATRDAYKNASINAEVVPFIDDMPASMAAATLVVCRSGATTVAELSALGKPAIYVPFPFATDNHQEHNARAVVDAGGALMFRQAQLTGDALGQVIGELLFDNDRLTRMGKCAAAFGKPHAGSLVVDELERLAGLHA